MRVNPSVRGAIVCALFFSVQLVSAQGTAISHWTFSGGGTVSANANYRLAGSVAQPAIGRAQNSETVHTAGFWYPLRGMLTGVDNNASEVPKEFALEQNYPNPFNPSTVIRIALPQGSPVSLEVYNPLGQKVAELMHGERAAGYYQILFDARGLSSGVYFYRLQAGEFVQTRRLLLVR